MEKKHTTIPTATGITLLVIFGGALIYLALNATVWEEERKSGDLNSELNMQEKGSLDEKQYKKDNSESQKFTEKDSSASQPTQNSSKGRLSGDGCYEMKDGQIDEYHFRTDFNTDPSNTTVYYENKEAGIAFNVPFNKNWGNNDCTVLPFIESGSIESGLGGAFGPVRAFIGDSYRFHTAKSRTAKDIIEEQDKVGGEPAPNPRVKMIGDHEAVVYESYGIGTSRIYEVLGKNRNIVFEHFQIDRKDKALASQSTELEQVIKSLRISE